MAELTQLCPHCGGDINNGLNCAVCRVLFGNSKTFSFMEWARRTPPPATKVMLETISRNLTVDPWEQEGFNTAQLQTFLAEWAEPPTPEQPEPSSPWRCSLCGKPVRIGNDLQPHHISYVGYAHAAELFDKDKQILIDNLNLTD